MRRLCDLCGWNPRINPNGDCSMLEDTPEETYDYHHNGDCPFFCSPPDPDKEYDEWRDMGLQYDE